MKQIKYVVSNPEKDTRLEKTDLVFVLARNDPGDPEQWDEYTQNNKDMFDANQNKLMAQIDEMTIKNKKMQQKKGKDGKQGNNKNEAVVKGGSGNNALTNAQNGE